MAEENEVEQKRNVRGREDKRRESDTLIFLILHFCKKSDKRIVLPNMNQITMRRIGNTIKRGMACKDRSREEKEKKRSYV